MAYAIEANQMKDCRLRDNRSRAFKALAVEFVKSGKAYAVASEQELAAKYPDLCDKSESTEKYVWAIYPMYKVKNVNFSFVAIKTWTE